MRAESLVHPATATGVVGIDASSAIRRELAPGVEVEIIALGPDDRLHMRRGEHLAECETEGRSSWRLRDACLDRSLERICVLQDVRDSGDAAVVTLAVRTLGPLITADRIRFLFDERIKEGVGRIGGPFAARDPGAWLAERCILPPMRPGGASRLLLARGGEVSEESDLDRPFSIVGDGIRLDVHLRGDLSDDGGMACFVTRLSPTVRGRNMPVRAVLEADAAFIDHAEDAFLSAQAKAQLDAIARSEGSLLNLWRQYQDIEIEASERKSAEHPTVPYASSEDRGEGRYRLEIPEDCAGKHRLSSGDEVGLLEQNRTPEQIAEMLRGSPDGATAPRGKESPKEWPATVEKVDRGGQLVTVRCDRSPPERGFIGASILGELRMQDRRRHALDLIRHDNCRMKQLGLMLEEIGPLTTRRGRSERPVTARLLERVFTDTKGRSWQPTAAQRAAIDVALNTPDIAVIQGPPGTGKTTVMRAIIERIHELNSKDPGRRDRFLVTGFQHDAVENATDGLEVDGVPALKAGGRRGSGDGTQKEQEDLRIDGFVERILRSSTVLVRSAMKAHAELREIDEEIARFTAEPHSAAATVAMIDSLRTKFGARLSRDLDESLAELGERMRRDSDREADPDMERLERAIRAIRCYEVAFADDGPETAALALFLLRRAGTAVCLDALERAGAVRGEPGPDLLEDLGSLRHRLLLTHVRRRGGESLAFRNDDLLALLEQVRTEMRDRTATTSSADEIAMARFRESLEDREALRETLKHYSMVIGATCQQSVAGLAIERLGGDAEALTYENVLCDEAARANPLDLLIPMSRAKQRIILVGDHRQLPHIVEDSIAARLLSDRLESVGEGESAEQVRAEFIRALETSLFERIRSVLVERERKDGYRRVVTLNQQFRMHPTLGEFVSDRFYPPGERFSSPRPASDFVHGCRPFLGRCAAWHDVPGEVESLRDKSRVRSIEAREIARLLKGMLDDTDGAGATTTFGIITFYRAQVDEIDRELVRVGIKIAREHGEPQLAGAYEGRVRVGTVDAFQGREFDVVFLSVVRSNGKEEPVKRYGHLMSPNRMCVSMSRQKRLLVVVGDRRILGKTAERDVPALHAFAKLADAEDERARRSGGGR